jgi:hypothetical protein
MQWVGAECLIAIRNATPCSDSGSPAVGGTRGLRRTDHDVATTQPDDAC